MFKILLIFFIIYIQLTIGKKHKKPHTTLEKATEKVSTFLKDVKDFFQDIVEAITDLIGFHKTKKKKTVDEENEATRIFLKNIIESGYKVLKGAIPILDMARATVNDFHLIMPNVTTTRFFKSLLKQLVPDLMKNQQNIG